MNDRRDPGSSFFSFSFSYSFFVLDRFEYENEERERERGRAGGRAPVCHWRLAHQWVADTIHTGGQAARGTRRGIFSHKVKLYSPFVADRFEYENEERERVRAWGKGGERCG